MDIVKITHRTDFNPQTLVEVLEDTNTTWGITEPVDRREDVWRARLIASSIHYLNDSARDQKYLYDLSSNLTYKVDIHNKIIIVDHKHTPGQTRHVDHIEEWAH